MSGELLRRLSEERIFKDRSSDEESPELSGEAGEGQRMTSQKLAIASIISRSNGVMR